MTSQELLVQVRGKAYKRECRAQFLHPCDLMRVSRGAFGGDISALLGQELSKSSALTCALSARKDKTLDKMEPACILCHQAHADWDTCGAMLDLQGVYAHTYCLIFANAISPLLDVECGLLQFCEEEIEHAVEQGAQKECCECHQSGATITCSETGCDVSFHLPCATRGGCVTQYIGLYSAFCREHAPRQEVEAVPEEDTTCLICMDPVDNQTSYRTMVCPACQHAWFHRECIQVGAHPSLPGDHRCSATPTPDSCSSHFSCRD
ncbi:PHD finger protein 7-like [Melanerpes formicivorus]|uniref:PHD finger protein 7-like n=1 Tax=Melanerpes formicivorus TaxID=211600 RepID=UPI00358E4A79